MTLLTPNRETRIVGLELRNLPLGGKPPAQLRCGYNYARILSRHLPWREAGSGNTPACPRQVSTSRHQRGLESLSGGAFETPLGGYHDPHSDSDSVRSLAHRRHSPPRFHRVALRPVLEGLTMQQVSPLFSAISSLDDAISDLDHWADVLLHLSASEIRDESGMVLCTVSKALRAYGKELAEKSQTAFDLAAARRFEK
jgi:hypothetical protein